MGAEEIVIAAVLALVMALFVYWLTTTSLVRRLWQRRPHVLRWISKTLVRFFVTGLKAWAESEKDPSGRDSDWLDEETKGFAKQSIGFVVTGLKAWAESERHTAGKDTVWDWLTDQVFVVQGRYAFAIGCIAFDWNNDRLRCLMVERKHDIAAESTILLWPGGRVRGSHEDFESEIKGIVRDETDCTVHLLGVSSTPTGFCEKVESYNPRTSTFNVENSLLQPPIMVMQQNRLQRNDVPGHTDLLYLGHVAEEQVPGLRGRWLDISDIGKYDSKILWPDTKRCILHAAEEFRRVVPSPTTLGEP